MTVIEHQKKIDCFVKEIIAGLKESTNLLLQSWPKDDAGQPMYKMNCKHGDKIGHCPAGWATL